MKIILFGGNRKILDMLGKSLIALSLLLSFSGCSTVPVSMNLPQQSSGLYLNSDKDKFPYDVAVLIPDSFSEHMLKSTLKNMNMTYVFQYDIGNDFSETLPEFLSERFNKVTIVKSLDNTEKYDFIFIPNISKSRINTRINTTIAQEPVYALEINLHVLINKNGKNYSETTIKEGIERATEVACWTCFGKDILNQQKIEDEYKLVISNIYVKFDSYILDTIKR
jgi:hypothetical protein